MSDVPGEPGPDSIADNGPIPPREQLVKTAAKFLSSSNVVNSPNDSKVAFLKKKGLSDAEIDLAMKQAEVIVQSRNFLGQSCPPNAVMPYAPNWHQQPSWMKYRDIANSVALIGGLAYAVYWFYKKYLAPFLFGGGKKGLDARLSDLDKMITGSLTDLKTSVSRVRDDVERLTERRVDSLSRQIEELKAEVSSLKKLMLSRKQFPSATVSGPLTIPSWQLASAAEEKEAEEEGAGSGTNGSDSSLEMIKE
ncbi:Peroxisomal membrane [Nesidiocoris tenuis]|uniref:Peroxisomal membrane protein PEX14 n=1 Tax=Nesidiocoris tenuis TaxID=355587 RepID=A0ABN7AYZ1_9HEMI|nr:Peroxisomal membrane [Nesidiocoris tenuis]